MASFWNYAKEYLPTINKEVLAALPTEPKTAYKPIRDLIESGGKRVRSVLCLLTCKALGGKDENAIEYAKIMELLHNFTLIHDDIEDESQQRRSKPAMHTTHGVPAALNHGDILIALALKLTSKLQNEKAREIIGDSLVTTGEGQAFDIALRNTWDFDTSSYSDMVKGKTGALFGAACALGVLAAKKDDAIETMRHYGIETGAAFQIQDDVLNIVGDEKKYGKEIGGDITEKKKTLMVAYIIEKAEQKDKDQFLKLWNVDPMPSENVPRIIEIMKRAGAIDYATDVAASFAESAKKRLDTIEFADKEAAEGLKSFVDFVITREF